MPETAVKRGDWIRQMCVEGSTSIRREVFDRHPEWHDAGTLRAMRDDFNRSLYPDQVRAHRLAELVHWVADAAGDRLSLAISLRCHADLDYAKGRHEASMDAYRRALLLLDPQHVESGRIYAAGLQPLISLERYQEAQAWAARARSHFESHNDALSLARLEVSAGHIFFRQNQYQPAMGHYERALVVLERSPEPADYPAALSNIAACCIHLGQPLAALARYHDARNWCDEHKLSALAARTHYNLAFVHCLRGEYEKALAFYRQSRQRCEITGEVYHSALCDLDESGILLELGLIAEAGLLASRAALAFEQMGMNYQRAKATLNHAAACFRRGEATSANKLLRDCRKWFAREGNRYWRALLDLYQSVLSDYESKSAEAQRYAERALGVLAHSPLTSWLSFCQALLAHLKLDAGKLEEAAAHLREMGKGLHSPALRFHFHFLRGELYEKTGEPESALREYAAAIREMDDPRRALWVEELKISFINDKSAAYARAVQLSLRLRKEGGEAFLWVQRAKSAPLLEKLYAEPPDELRRNLTADYHLLELATGAARAPTNEVLRPLRVRLQEGEEQLERLFGLKRYALETLPLALIQQTLDPDAALVEFFPFGERLALWILTRNNLHYVACERVNHLRTCVRLLIFQLSSPNPAHAAQAHLRELYCRLIEPAAKLLIGQRVIFAPSGFLRHVPFHRLLDANGRPFGENHTVSYARSASMFALNALYLSSEASPPPQTFPTKYKLFRNGSYRIDLCLEEESNSMTAGLTGQIARQEDFLQPAADVVISLLANKQMVHQITSNEYGEFLFDFVKRPRLHLRFDLANEAVPIDLPLKDFCN